VVAQQRQRHNQRDHAAAMIVNGLEQLVAVAGLQQALQMPDRVHHHVGVAARRCRSGQRVHEQALVLRADRRRRVRHRVGDQASELGIAAP